MAAGTAVMRATRELFAGSPKMAAREAAPPVLTGVPIAVALFAMRVTTGLLAASPRMAPRVAVPPEFRGVPTNVLSCA
jgi:hypothetical protein